MKICLIPSDPSGPGYYRLLFPATYLEKAGHEILLPPYKVVGPDEKGNRTVHFLAGWPVADIYVIQRRMEKGLATRIIPALKEQGHVIVLEADDDDFHIPSWHPAHGAADPAKSPNLNRNWLKTTAGLADAVSVSTPYLGKVYSKFNSNVHVIQNYLEWEMWKDVTPVFRSRDWERTRIGWLGAIKLREGDIRAVAGTLGPWLRKNPEVDFMVVGDGADEVHDLIGTPIPQRLTSPGVNFNDEDQLQKAICQFDIGIVPLDSVPFNEAKSYLKGMEYGACGIPAVTSDTEQYREWIDEGVNGFRCERPRDWTRGLDALVGDESLRRRMGGAARDKARRYSLDRQAHQWIDFYEALEPMVLAGKSIQKGAIQKQKELGGFLKLAGKPRVVVEIGTHAGGVFYGLCQIADPSALVVSIDLPAEEIGADKIDYSSKAVIGDEKIRAHGQPGQEIHLIRGDSHSPESVAELEKILDGREIDVLFIDGDHTYDGVKQDYELYNGYVRPGGMVVFHDIIPIYEHYATIHNDGISEVDKFWAEVSKGRKTAEFKAEPKIWGGIGVLYKAEAQGVRKKRQANARSNRSVVA